MQQRLDAATSIALEPECAVDIGIAVWWKIGVGHCDSAAELCVDVKHQPHGDVAKVLQKRVVAHVGKRTLKRASRAVNGCTPARPIRDVHRCIKAWHARSDKGRHDSDKRLPHMRSCDTHEM